jgi:hypothetical protein
MDIHELRNYLNSIPDDFDNYQIVFSDVSILNDKPLKWSRRNTYIENIILDSTSENLIIGTGTSIDNIIKLSNKEQDGID